MEWCIEFGRMGCKQFLTNGRKGCIFGALFGFGIADIAVGVSKGCNLM